MQTSHLVAALLGGALVGAGIWIGATAFGGAEDPAPPAAVDRPAGPEPAAVPTLGGRDPGPGEGAHRQEALEQRLAALEATLAEREKQLEPLHDLFEQAREAGLLDADGSPLSGVVPLAEAGALEMEPDAHFGRGFARALADTLGLDPSRKAALQEAVDGIFGKIEVLEKENATVDTEGDTTRIQIGTYDGSELERDWQDWVSKNLTPDEQAKLQREHAANRIFGSRLGGFERTIRILEAGGMIDLTETAKHGDDQVTETQMQGPALARDHMLAPYTHLLK